MHSCLRDGMSMSVTRAGVSRSSGTQYEIMLSVGDHAKSLHSGYNRMKTLGYMA